MAAAQGSSPDVWKSPERAKTYAFLGTVIPWATGNVMG
jgi:hypothetical protein